VDGIIGQIDWSQAGGFVMTAVFVILVFERAWKLFEKVTSRNKEDDEEDEEEPRIRCVPPDVNLRRMAQQINDLHEMHDVFDPDGVRVWYVRRSFYEMMEKSSEALQKISALLPTLVGNQQKMDQRLEDIQHNTQRKD
jgi:hypothetical protein